MPSADAIIGFRSNSREEQVYATLASAGVAALARAGSPLADRPDLVRDICIGVHVDMRHMPRMRAGTDAVVEALRKNAVILNPSR